MDVATEGARNLAAFVAATSGRRGEVVEISGGVAVRAPFPVAHGYVDTAVPIGPQADPARFVDEAVAQFHPHGRSFVAWSLASDEGLVAELAPRGVEHDSTSTAMVVDHPVGAESAVEVTPVVTDDDRATFGALAEEGYAEPGMAWLLDHHDCYRADVRWCIARLDGEAMGVACGYRTQTVGGVYYVATPERFRGRGVASAVTAAVTDDLLADGAQAVVLQASAAGYPVYVRLGFEVYGHYRRFELAPPS